jgi:Ca2+-binding RTX toxin-like protein
VTAANGITATRANLLALGVDGSQLNSATSAYNGAVTDIDFSITFNALVNWDYDRGNGLTSGYYDFYAYAVQAMFKGLGFISNVDVAAGQSSGSVAPTTLDLFRVAPGAAANDFTLASRVLTAGSDAVFYDGGVFDPASVGLTGNVGEVAMSTGITGDGRAAASWKDDFFTGKTMGLMDATFPNGTYQEIRTTDLRALGLIGYDVNPQIPTLAPDGELSILGTSGHDTITISYGGLYSIWVNGAKTSYFNQNVSRITVDGGAGNDNINHAFGSRPMTVYGGSGHDTIVGGHANDVIYGGDGDDHITGSKGSDFISGGAGYDIVTYADKTAGINVSFDGVANDGNAGEGDNVQDDIDEIVGTAYNDVINASAKSSGIVILAGAGNDTLYGSAFSDTIYGQDGADTLYANDGVMDNVDGGAGTDTIYRDVWDVLNLWELIF